MAEPLRILPPPEVPEWMEKSAAHQEEVRGEREAWTGRPVTRGFSQIGEALKSLASHDWKLPKRKARSRAEKIAYADHLRANMTRAEMSVWEWLQGFGLDFTPQVVVGGWIVDFYSESLNLIIEVDGSAHDVPHRIEQDAQREQSLIEKGYRIARITNRDVIVGDFTALLSAIGGG